MKFCYKCNSEKDESAFSKDKNSPDGLQSQCKECFKLYKKQYHKSNKDKAGQYKKSYYANNKRSVLDYNNQYYKDKRKNDPSFRLRDIISSAVNRALRGKKGGKSFLQHVPYSMDELKAHLEKQFEPWMNWNNHGKFSPIKRTWQIDHIIPQSKLPYFNMTDDNFQKCWALSNLRPLESFINLKKSNK